MKSDSVTIALSAWNEYQLLIRSSGDAMWKIRTAFYAVASALVAAGYSSDSAVIYSAVPFIALLFLLLEGGHKRIQIQYIRKSLDIERTLTDFLVDEPSPYLPGEGISTSLSTPTARDLLELFSLKRFLFWFPYLAVSTLSVLLYIYGIQKSAA
jgi:hypothetical protein